MAVTTKDRKAALQSVATLIPSEAVADAGGVKAPVSALLAAAMARKPAKPKVAPFSEPTEIGTGVWAQMEGDILTLAFNIGEDARAIAEPSSTGALCLLANTGGFKPLQGLGIKLNVVAGFTNPKAPVKSKQRVRE